MPIGAHLAQSSTITPVQADNRARRLKILKGFTPHEFIYNCWTSLPERLILDLLQQMPGLEHDRFKLKRSCANLCV
jgi:hypothetical protein